MPKPKVLLVGWDAADWKVIRPLLDAGQMPNLARFLAQGVRGNLATIYPVLSPMLWTSIATGKRAYKHGIHGFSEPLPDGSGVRPVTLLSRKTKAIWNILNQNGHRSIVVGWWPSHPAEPLNGVMVSNHFCQPVGKPGDVPPLPRGTVHPPSLADSLGELRVNPMELSGEFIRLFVPEYRKVDHAKDKRLHTLGKIIAETMSVHAAATELLATQPWDFAAVYYSAIDHFGHAFMSYHPPRLPWVKEADFAIYQHVIANAYRYHDSMLGALLSLADDDTNVILMSDHGFHPDHLRAGYIPANSAGPAIEHRHFGILCLRGPGIRADEQIFGASLLDICPTILTLFNLPPGKDMDGKVLLNAFKEPREIKPIESWDSVPGETGSHPPETQLDFAASAEAFKQLVELGYVVPPGDDIQTTVDECVREQKYNLARAYRDGNCCGEAAALVEELWDRWPKEHRFGILLVDCLNALALVERRREAIEELARRLERYEAEAKAELARRVEERRHKKEEEQSASEVRQRRLQFEERQLRELACGRPQLIEWFRISQDLLEQNTAKARKSLARLARQDDLTDGMRQRVASALADLGDLETGRQMLESALDSDVDNPLVHSQLAAIHAKAGRFEEAVASATESLSLLYFQPGVHALLGRALMKTKRFAEAEQELRVAVAQSPRNLAAHELLSELYRDCLNRPQDAFAHEGLARSLRHELAAQKRARTSKETVAASSEGRIEAAHLSESKNGNGELPPPFRSEVDTNKVITVVSGLPRSGTSMMMQLLTAAGREVLTDAKRRADEDNPLGYFEFEKTLTLAKDATWLPQARGKVIKVVAQLLPFLPRNEHYHVIFMERNLSEVIASQNVMLARQGRRGAALGEKSLSETYAAQLKRVRGQLSRRSEVRILSVNYDELLSDSAKGVKQIARFLGGEFNHEVAAGTIRPELRRQKAQHAH